MSADQQIEELERQAAVVSRRLRELADLEWEMVIDATDEAHARFDAEYGGEVSANQVARQDLRLGIENWRVAAAKGEESPYPEGMRMVQWDRSSHHYPWRRTGKFGVVEIFSRESDYPANRTLGLPGIGGRCVRLLKKGGAPSLAIESFRRGDPPRGWYPEGVDPNEEKGIQQ